MHPVEQDSGYHISLVPGLGSGVFGLISLSFGQNLVKLLVPLAAGGALLMAGTHVLAVPARDDGRALAGAPAHVA